MTSRMTSDCMLMTSVYLDKRPACRSAQDANTARRVILFGYVRGTFLKPGMRVHVPGLGDFSMADVDAISDPCPFPSTEKRRRLNQKEKLLHAPMANLGELT